VRLSIVVAAVIAIAACSKDEGKDKGASGDTAKAAEGDEADEPSKAEAAVLDAWKDKDLEVDKSCRTGTVKGLDVAICEYDSPEAAKAATKAGYSWVGATTGSAWVSGSLVIAVADRSKADPSGKTINELMKSSPK
jgi:hypothetical protein